MVVVVLSIFFILLLIAALEADPAILSLADRVSRRPTSIEVLDRIQSASDDASQDFKLKAKSHTELVL